MKPAFGTQSHDESCKESYRGCWTAGEKGMASSRPAGHTTTGGVAQDARQVRAHKHTDAGGWAEMKGARSRSSIPNGWRAKGTGGGKERLARL